MNLKNKQTEVIKNSNCHMFSGLKIWMKEKTHHLSVGCSRVEHYGKALGMCQVRTQWVTVQLGKRIGCWDT